MSIKSIKITNFRQFDFLGMNCRHMNILVGPNNSGKSTCLDALRVLNDVVRYAGRRNPTPESQGEFGVCATHRIDHSSISIPIKNITKNYSGEDASIEAAFENGVALHVRLNPEKPVVAFLVADGRIPRTASEFRRHLDLEVVVVPTLGPLEETEKYVSDETVRRNETTRLAHRNFRNIWERKSEEEFAYFAELIRQAWPDIEVQKPTRYGVGDDASVVMFYTEKRMTREVYWSGFGFQVWMQMMMHIIRGGKNAILVLDEPDIYLHPDLQRRITKIAASRFSQVFIATHSTEIINEVNAGDIFLVSSKYRNARRITSEDGYRDLMYYIGSSDNASFARLSRSKRIVFFEGEDRKILRKFALKISDSSILDDPETVFLKAGGFGQWRRVIEAKWTLQSVFGIDAKVAAIFDRDYRCEDDIAEFIEKISDSGAIGYVLARKEIENYALVLDPLVRAIKGRLTSVSKDINDEKIVELLSEISQSFKDRTLSRLAGDYAQYQISKKTAKHYSTLFEESLESFNGIWEDLEKRFCVIPGKEFISELSRKLQQEYGVAITIVQIVNEMKRDEVPEDLRVIIDNIENSMK